MPSCPPAVGDRVAITKCHLPPDVDYTPETEGSGRSLKEKPSIATVVAIKDGRWHLIAGEPLHIKFELTKLVAQRLQVLVRKPGSVDEPPQDEVYREDVAACERADGPDPAQEEPAGHSGGQAPPARAPYWAQDVSDADADKFTNEWPQSHRPSTLLRSIRNKFSRAATPLEMFLLFFTSAMVHLVCEATNQYAVYCLLSTGKDPDNWVPVSYNELLSFLGVHVAMSIVQFPHYQHYWWTGSPILGHHGIVEHGVCYLPKENALCVP